MSTLKFDFDWTPPEQWIQGKIRLINYVLWKCHIEREESERGFHLIIKTLHEYTDEEICYFQWLLGDDQTRARLNYSRLLAGVQNWNKLFHHKIKDER